MAESRRQQWTIVAIVVIVVLTLTFRQLPWVYNSFRHYQAEELNCQVQYVNPGVDELSGIAYYPIRNTLLLDSDQGQLVEMDLQYHVLDRYDIPGDVEAVAVHPITGSIFIAAERDGAIIEYDLSQRRALRTMRVDFGSHPDFQNGMVINKGLEGVAIVMDGSNKAHLFASVEAKPARVIELLADVSRERTDQLRGMEIVDSLVGVQEDATILASYYIGVSRISDILFDADLGALLVLSSTETTLTICDLQGNRFHTFRLPGEKLEGFCFLPNGDGLVVQDCGGMWVVKGLKAALVPAKISGE